MLNSNENKAYSPVPEGSWEMIIGNIDDRVSSEKWNERVRSFDQVSVTVYKRTNIPMGNSIVDVYMDDNKVIRD